jgi:hypothetical protein
MKLQTHSLPLDHNQTCPYRIQARLLQQKDDSIWRLLQPLHGLLITHERVDTALHELVPVPLQMVQLVTNTATLPVMFGPSLMRQQVEMAVYFASMCDFIVSAGISS